MKVGTCDPAISRLRWIMQPPPPKVGSRVEAVQISPRLALPSLPYVQTGRGTQWRFSLRLRFSVRLRGIREGAARARAWACALEHRRRRSVCDPERQVRKWVSQVTQGGLLLLQETEAIESSHSVIPPYLEMVRALLVSRGGDLYVGKRLASMPEPDKARRTLNRATTFHVPISLAAQIFTLNIESSRDDVFIREN